MRAWKSAEIKISNRNGFKIKLMTNIVVKIENKSAPKAGLLIAGTSKYVNGVGSKITINYVDDKLFEKLEHEFAHAILNSNNIAKGHEEKYDSDFYNWNLSRNLGSG